MHVYNLLTSYSLSKLLAHHRNSQMLKHGGSSHVKCDALLNNTFPREWNLISDLFFAGLSSGVMCEVHQSPLTMSSAF